MRHAKAVVSMLALGLSASANPVMSTAVFVEQVPGTHHLQVTWYGMPAGAFYTRDDKAYALEWKPFDGYRAELGSGVQTSKVQQACECNLTVGKHVLGSKGTKGMIPPYFEALTVSVVENKLDPAKEPQGLDCRAFCKDGRTSRPGEQPADTAMSKSIRYGLGKLVLEGRYLKPPYSVSLADYKLTVNGKTVETFLPLTPMSIQEAAFEAIGRGLHERTLVIRCGTQTFTAPPDTSEAVLAAIDAIMKSADDPKTKRERLSRADGASICSDGILKNWDGWH